MAKDIKLTDEQADNLGTIIPQEMFFTMLMLMTADLLVLDVDKRLKQISQNFHIGKEFKQQLNTYKAKVADCRRYYDGLIEPHIINSGRGHEYQNFEETRLLANETIRLMLLSYEKTKDKASSDALFDFLQSLPKSRGIFSIDDINKFSIR